MNSSELAHLMLYWESQKKGLAKTEERIKEAVLELGETVDTGNVRASHYAGRKKYDYETAACPNGLPVLDDDLWALFTTTVPETKNVDWRGLCRQLSVKHIPFTQGEPSVTIKLTE